MQDENDITGATPRRRPKASVLEIGVLRGPAPALGIEGMRAALATRRAEEDRRAPRPRKRLTEADWDLADALLERLGAAA